MKKNLVIGLLLLLTLLSTVFALIKANDAEKQMLAAEVTWQEAEKNAQEAKVQSQKALDAAERATKARAEFEKIQEMLRECQSK